ncbi:MAG TPA: hypothetical protein VFM35_09795, partial [Candidatus Binatia bacterium]|nr:hypothetical protein [Candidatus Binatia bacterium]
MRILNKFFSERKKGRVELDDSSLRAQIATGISAFISIRGLHSLLKPDTAVVLRQGYETFITQDVGGIENRESVIAVVYLKDTGYEQFKEILSDQSLRSGALGQMSLGYLASEVAKQMLKQVV